MKHYTYFFIAYVIAILSGTGAYAATNISGLATTNYVDTAIDAEIADKADKATTLAGYGIGDAYTKTQTDSAITTKINTLDATNNVTAGNYITAVNETDGKVSVTTAKMDTTPTADSTAPVTSGGVAAALAGKQASLGYTAENVANKTATIAAAASANDTKYPTEKAVRTALDTKADKSAIPTKVSQLTNDSSYATTTAVALKQDITNMAADATTDVGAMADADKLKKYPSVALMEGYVGGQIQSSTNSLGDLAFENTVNTNFIDDGAVTAEKVAAGVIANGTNTTAARDSSTGVYKVNVATANGSTLGVVKAGTNTSISSGSVNVATANGSTLGVVKQGTNTTISSGAVSVATGTPTQLGVVKVGQIPSGSETSTTYAQIWVQ